jgi:hypothetical protein
MLPADVLETLRPLNLKRNTRPLNFSRADLLSTICPTGYLGETRRHTQGHRTARYTSRPSYGESFRACGSTHCFCRPTLPIFEFGLSPLKLAACLLPIGKITSVRLSDAF